MMTATSKPEPTCDIPSYAGSCSELTGAQPAKFRHPDGRAMCFDHAGDYRMAGVAMVRL